MIQNPYELDLFCKDPVTFWSASPRQTDPVIFKSLPKCLVLIAASSAASPALCQVTATSNLRIQGALPTDLNDMQQALTGVMFILARNELAGTPDGLSEPWPCAENSEGAVFLPNTVQAYQNFKSSMKEQGYQIDLERLDKSSDQYSFLMSKDKVVLLGMWAKAALGDRSTLVICERAINWKPTPPPAAPALAPGLKNNLLAGRVEGWKLGNRTLVTLAAVNHGYYDDILEEEESFSDEEDGDWPDTDILSSGQIKTSGDFILALPMGKDIPQNLLRPIEQATLPEDAYYDYDDNGPCPPKGALKVSRSGAVGLSIDTLTVLEAGFSGSNQSAMERATTDETLVKNGSTNTRTYSSSLRLVYSGQPVSIKGQISCFGFGFSGKTDIDLNLPAGWSFVEVLIPNGSNEAGSTKFQNAPAVKLENWQLEKRP